MHLSSILSLIAKGLNTYVNKVFLKKCLKTCFHFVIMGYLVLIDEEKQLLNPISDKAVM